MATKIDEGFAVYGAVILSQHVSALEKEISGVKESKDIEYIHRMRVASRRLRSALPVFGVAFPAKKVKTWVEQVRKITRALGAARDVDVQIDTMNSIYHSTMEQSYLPGLRRLLLRWRQKREDLQHEVIDALEQYTASGAGREIEKYTAPLVALKETTYLYTPYLYQIAYSTISNRLNNMLSYEVFITDPQNVEQLHAMRIAAKRLRYTCEMFAELYPDELKITIQTLKRLQDHLGEIHDCDVWGEILPVFLQEERGFTLRYFGQLRTYRRLEPGFIYFFHGRTDQRNQLYDAFISDWVNIKEKQIWENLLSTIRVPFFRAAPESSLKTSSDIGSGDRDQAQ